jgi:hypothetical protein
VVAEQRFPSYADDRGSLLPIELAEVPFVVRRVFVVRGVDSRLPRGDHDVPCEELVVLMEGSVQFDITSSDGPERVVLDKPGASLLLQPGTSMSYVLDGPGSTIMVLASAPHGGRP